MAAAQFSPESYPGNTVMAQQSGVPRRRNRKVNVHLALPIPVIPPKTAKHLFNRTHCGAALKGKNTWRKSPAEGACIDEAILLILARAVRARIFQSAEVELSNEKPATVAPNYKRVRVILFQIQPKKLHETQL
jgi:hypothetical protein